MQHHAIDHTKDVTLTFIHWFLIIIYLLTLTILIQSPEQNSEAAAGVVLKNFANFTEKHLCWSLFFTKLRAFRPATLLKKRLLKRCFPMKNGKFWITPISKNIWTTSSVYWLLHHILIFAILYRTQLSFLQIASSLLRNQNNRTNDAEAVSFEKAFHWTKFLAFES